MEISLIIPVYNGEKYIEECLDSVLNQSMSNIEIIVVNDGSTDNSLSILKDYKKSNEQIKIINKENAGASEARRDGVKHATGKYICFLDNDDFLHPLYIETMYNMMKKTGADLVECPYTRFDSIENTQEEPMSERGETYFIDNKTGFIDQIFRKTIINGNVATVVWNKMYKKKLIEEAVSDYGKSPLDDYFFNMQYYSVINTYVYINKIMVFYRVTSNSLSRSYDPTTFNTLIEADSKKRKVMEKIGADSYEDQKEADKWFFSYLLQALTILFVNSKLNTELNKKEHIKEILSTKYLENICQKQRTNNLSSRIICQKRVDIIILYLSLKSKMIQTKWTIKEKLSQ